MTLIAHCPYRQATLLQQALAPDKMRIAFLLGAGCPVSINVEEAGKNQPLIPDIRRLTAQVRHVLGDSVEHKDKFAAVWKRLSGAGTPDPTIEDVLSHIRSLHDVVRDGSIDGLDRDALASLDAEICRITTKVVDVRLPSATTPYHRLATWVGGVQRAHPVEIFTPNYDLLVEQAFEAYKIPYFDGFVGARHAFFDLASMENDSLPARWSRLWKLHGSINWWRTADDEVVRCDGAAVGNRQMIYPSHLKYDQSRRMPYLAMLDRLRAFLARGQAILVACGYSFADQHLNEVILHGLRSNPTAMCFGLLFGSRSNYSNVVAKARMHPNLSLLASDGAVLGTVERDWRADENTGHPFHGLAVTKKDSGGGTGTPAPNCEFVLGDFQVFGEFLARQLSRFDEEQAVVHAA